MNKEIRLLVVDDHNLVREGVIRLLAEVPGFHVVGEARNGMEAVQVNKEKFPDIIVMDISMPMLNGLDAAERILKDNSRARVIILSMHCDDITVTRALKIGVSGFLLKTAAGEELVEAVRMVSQKKTYLSPEVSARMMNISQSAEPPANKNSLQILTMKERHILQLIAEGNSSKGIADLLGVSFHTVKTHRNNLMEKLGLHSVADLTRYAIENKLTIYTN